MVDMKVTIIIPVFNEEATIASVLEAILALGPTIADFEILVSDDGSEDRTRDRVRPFISEDSRLRMVVSPTNRGKGAAIRQALGAASGDVVLIQDADTEYSPTDYPTLLAPFADESVGAVYGSRFLDRRWPRGMRLQNWLANRCFTITTNMLFNGSITDEGTGYKVFRRNLLQSLSLECDGFEFCAEATAKLLLRDIVIREVPVSYTARRHGHGHRPGFRDGLRVLWTLARTRFTSDDLNEDSDAP